MFDDSIDFIVKKIVLFSCCVCAQFEQFEHDRNFIYTRDLLVFTTL
jgi:hypothetical protein